MRILTETGQAVVTIIVLVFIGCGIATCWRGMG